MSVNISFTSVFCFHFHFHYIFIFNCVRSSSALWLFEYSHEYFLVLSIKIIFYSSPSLAKTISFCYMHLY